MGFARIDHRVLTDPKTAGLSTHDFGVFIKAIVYCSREETDGQFSARSLAQSCHSRDIAPTLLRLSSAGLVAKVCHSSATALPEDGQSYAIVGYLKHQSSKRLIEAKRAKDRDRKSEVPKTNSTRKKTLPRTEYIEQSTENIGNKPPNPLSRGKSVCPEDFEPTSKDRAKVEALGIDVGELVTEMVDWSASDRTKNKRSDWNAVFRTWARRRVKDHKTRQELEERKDKRFTHRSDQLTEHDKLYVERQKKEQARRLAEAEKNRKLFAIPGENQ